MKNMRKINLASMVSPLTGILLLSSRKVGIGGAPSVRFSVSFRGVALADERRRMINGAGVLAGTFGSCLSVQYFAG